MPDTAVLTINRPCWPTENELMECIDSELAKRQAIRVEGDSVIFDPKKMKVGKFYCVEVKDEPYLYRKLNDDEIEVYGLAEKH